MTIDNSLEKLLAQPNITHLSLDSRRIKKGGVFIALSGDTFDGRAFIEQAVAQGAIAVLVESLDRVPNVAVPVIQIAHLKKKLSEIAKAFFHTPLNHLDLMGVTGTNGKTTTAYYMAQLLSESQEDRVCGLMGTLGYGFIDAMQLGDHTTPDPIVLHQQLSNLYQAGAKKIVMEVSSHALAQSRVKGLAFHTSVFTNLTHEHLDYHLDFNAYEQAKFTLFSDYTQKNGIINLDDPIGKAWFKRLKKEAKYRVFGYSCVQPEHTDSVSYLKAIKWDHTGVSAQWHSPWGVCAIQAPIFTEYNLSNVLAALTVACVEGVAHSSLVERVSRIQGAPGRMERLGEANTPTVVIDYAHTPDALERVLSHLKKHTQGKLWCIVGCGGQRDRVKRPIMARIADTLSDQALLTLDNPRDEDPKSIIQDMVSGLKQPALANIELDRKAAIALAIACAMPEDCILIAGKGHETIQIIGSQACPHDDKAIAQEALSRRNNACLT